MHKVPILETKTKVMLRQKEKKLFFPHSMLRSLFNFFITLLILIAAAQLLYLIERSLTFRKQLSTISQPRMNRLHALRILPQIIINSAYAIEKPPYQASRIQQSYPYVINLRAGKGFTFWVKFKNTGSQPWQIAGSEKVVLKSVSDQKGVFYHHWWPKHGEASRLKKVVLPGEIGFFKFALKAPEVNGLYWERFNLFTGGSLISGGDIEIAIRVYGGKSDQEERILPSSPTFSDTRWWQNISADLSQVQEDFKWQEPSIRIGLYFVERDEKENHLPIQIKSLNNESYEMRDKENFLLLRQTQGELTEIDFDFDLKRYFVILEGRRYLSTDSYLKFSSTDNKQIIFQIPSFENNIFWGAAVEDNKYRGSLEIHYNPNTKRLWIINELPMEDYLKGISEVSDDSPSEFLKAQMIAARTYAMFRKLLPKYTNTPDGTPLFTLRATQADQVYRGYSAEKRNPNTVKASQETAGIMVFYQGNIAKTYYFAQSDGYTRDCQAVGMCKEPTPYLISRKDPPGQGRDLRGHGVGLPQQGGRQAAQQGANFVQILKYYYPQTELKRVYR